METNIFINSRKDHEMWSPLCASASGKKIILEILAKVSGLESREISIPRDKITVIIARAENGSEFSVDVKIDVVEEIISFTREIEEYWFSHETDSTHSSRHYQVISSVPLTEVVIQLAEDSLNQAGKSLDARRWKENAALLQK